MTIDSPEAAVGGASGVQKEDRLPGLQIARAIAALGIAYFHSWHVTKPFPPEAAHPVALLRDYGWIGVDFFFAISGFVICMITTSPKFEPLPFLVRRAFRIYPLWIVASFAYLPLADCCLGRSAAQTDDLFYWSLTLLPTEGYPFYDLGWSLQHELAFYLLAAIVVPLFGLRGLIGALAAGFVADHLFPLPWYLHQYFSYYGNFLAGIAAFLVYRRTQALGFLLPLAAGLIPLSLTKSGTFYPIGLFCCLIAFANLRPRAGSTFAEYGPLLGDASYSIYLFHSLVLYWVYIKLQPPLPPDWMAEPLRYGALFLACAAAVGSWLLFERPMIWIGSQLARLVSWLGRLAVRGARARLSSGFAEAADVDVGAIAAGNQAGVVVEHHRRRR
jgi:peptidoglycan/LPS O-acetylase OafA/YrhL